MASMMLTTAPKAQTNMKPPMMKTGRVRLYWIFFMFTLYSLRVGIARTKSNKWTVVTRCSSRTYDGAGPRA